MTWPQIWRAPSEVSWSVFVFVFQLLESTQQVQHILVHTHRRLNLCHFYPIVSLLFKTVWLYALYYLTLLLSAFLVFLRFLTHSFSLVSWCLTAAPCTLLPLSHVCHSPPPVTIQQLCPDFNEAPGSKIQYLPGQTWNQYPPNANTAHRQSGKSANDAGSCPATEFSDYRAGMTKKQPFIASNPFKMLSTAELYNTQYISFTTRLHDKLNTSHSFDALQHQVWTLYAWPQILNNSVFSQLVAGDQKDVERNYWV